MPDLSARESPVKPEQDGGHTPAAARQMEALGGKLLRPPEDIPDIGRFCVLQDPQGATLCAITYRQP
ncbi:MAG: hypothetical protein WAW42_15215 [Candidatus Competibacteraceae bacterium]|jgi:hypothetical protein